MKPLIVFYSRTGKTKKIAETISKNIECDVEEIYDTKKRTGVLGWLNSGRDASFKNLTIIKDPTKDPSQYDLIIIGTPSWNNTMSTPILAYINQMKDKFKQVAFFCTQIAETSNTLEDMETACAKKPVSTLTISRKQIKSENYQKKIKEFVSQLQ